MVAGKEAGSDFDENETNRKAFAFLEKYLSGIAAGNIGIGFAVHVELDGRVDANVVRADRSNFSSSISRGLLDLIGGIHRAVALQERELAPGLYGKLSARFNYNPHILPFRSKPKSAELLPQILHVSHFLAVCFVAFHEFAHVRSGHFNYLASLDRAEVGGGRALSISEREGVGFGPASELSLSGLNAYMKHLEVEADILGFSTLIGVATELLMPDPGADDPRGLKPGDNRWRGDQREGALLVGEISFYATCICLSLLEAKRERGRRKPRYPRPFTRVLAIFRQLVVSTTSLWNDDDDDRRPGIVATAAASEVNEYARIMATALALCGFCCEATGLELPAKYAVASEADFLNDALALGGLLDGAREPRTMEAQELRRLDATAQGFRAGMRGFRIEPWDILDD